MPSGSKKIAINKKPWLAEHALTGAFARELIVQQFPELGAFELTYLGEGWDNTVYLVSTQYAQQWVFRFPRRRVAVSLLAHEKKTLNALSHFALDYPLPYFEGVPTKKYPWPFMGYTYVKGQSACAAKVSPSERHSWVPVLAEALKSLHGYAVPENLPGDLLKRVDLSYRIPWFETQMQQARQQGLVLPEKPIAKFMDALVNIIPEHLEEPHCLLHGDLYIRHLMVNEAKELTGIIDWGDTHQGHIATDLSVVYAVLPPEFHDAFWTVYGDVSWATRQIARLRALYSCLYIYRYGLDIGDEDLVREGKQGFQWFESLE